MNVIMFGHGLGWPEEGRKDYDPTALL